jgi:hypothetical protein
MCAVVVRMRQYLVLKGHGKWFAKSLGRFGVPYSSEVRAIRGGGPRREEWQERQAGHGRLVHQTL